MDYNFDISDTHLIITFKEFYYDKFVGGESSRTKQHLIPLKDVLSLITYLKDHSDEINRLLKHYREEEKQKLESELLDITSRLESI